MSVIDDPQPSAMINHPSDEPRARSLTPQGDGHRSALERWTSRVALDLDLREASHTVGLANRPRLTARALHLSPGSLDIDTMTRDTRGWLGLLILDGLVMVQLDVGRGHIGWLVGAGDVVRPWDMEDICLTKGTVWRALTPTRMVLIDDQFVLRAGPRCPTVTRAMVTQSARTAHWLLAKSLIISCPLVEERLMLLFALLGERWGKVTPAGIELNLPLTHALLATMSGARRPSVTLALRGLRNDGVVQRSSKGGWLLRRPDFENSSFHPSCWPRYAEALGLQ